MGPQNVWRRPCLGSQNTITAFALEDNKLWLKHALGLFFQVLAAAYVFLQALPRTKLAFPTLLVFVARIIKYLERTRALYLASLDKFRDSMLKEPDPGPNYAKLMDDTASKKEANLPTMVIMIEEQSGKKSNTRRSLIGERDGLCLGDLQVVHYAYHFFDIFKGLTVDLIFSFHERNESRDFFINLTPDDALRVIEVEPNFIYDALYNKVQVVHSRFGIIGGREIHFGRVGQFLSFIYGKAIHFLGFIIQLVIDFLGLTDFVDEIRYLPHEPLTKPLWKFIFDELKKKSSDEPENAKKISSARDNWILESKDIFRKVANYYELSKKINAFSFR
ncbi:hypothetical protein Q3G72_034750 [Acer saccharum]|nr:hypothetical protein Q3G72_034750 [Acer saccharum]